MEKATVQGRQAHLNIKAPQLQSSRKKGRQAGRRPPPKLDKQTKATQPVLPKGGKKTKQKSKSVSVSTAVDSQSEQVLRGRSLLSHWLRLCGWVWPPLSPHPARVPPLPGIGCWGSAAEAETGWWWGVEGAEGRGLEVGGWVGGRENEFGDVPPLHCTNGNRS